MFLYKLENNQVFQKCNISETCTERCCFTETQRQIKFAVKMGKILQVILFTPEMKMLGLCLGEGRDGGCSGREAERKTETDRQTDREEDRLEQSCRRGLGQMSKLSPLAGRQVSGSFQLHC